MQGEKLIHDDAKQHGAATFRIWNLILEATSMNTSVPTSLISTMTSPDGARFTKRQEAFITATTENIAHAAVLELFDRLSKEGKVTRASIARKIGKDPSQITRWLGSPSNKTMQTVGLLMAAMGYMPAITAVPVDEMTRGNYYNEAADLASLKHFTTTKNDAVATKVHVSI